MKNLKVKGFLSDDEIESVSRNKSQTSACAECGLYKHCKSPRMEFTGQGRKRTLIIAEMPGREEDEQNQQLIGKTGRYFRNLLDDRGLDLDEDFWKTNSVICYSKDKPSKKQLSLCRDNYLNVIDEVKPDFIWLLGKYAIESFFSGSFSEEEGTDLTPTRWRALCIPDPYTKAWVIPLFHPSYAMRNENDASTQAQYERDLDFAISCWKREPYDFPEVHDKIFIMKDFEEIEDNLLKVIKHPPEFFFFDYETTGLKPYNKGHRIASVSFCCEDDKAFSFPLHHPFFDDEKKQKAIELLWKEVLQNDSKKISHNCFSGDTKFITKKGLKSFEKTENTFQYVWTKKGWVKARIKSFGIDYFSRITLVPYNRSRSSIKHEILSTENHRWFIKRKFQRYKKPSIWKTMPLTTTKELKKGDCICAELPKYIVDYNSDAFRHGLIFADGSLCSTSKKRNAYGYQLRLCGWKEKFKNCFPKYTYPKSAKGDPVINYYKSDYDLKQLPDENKSAEYISNFIEGWRLLDGTIRGNSIIITTTKEEFALWLEENSSIGGWFCTGISKHHYTEENIGLTGKPYWMVVLTKDLDMRWTVRDIKNKVREGKTYCAVVPEEESFTIQYGIYTANSKFEEVWSRVILNVFINNWHWCTMNAAHIIDNRKRYSGLKFQAFIRWGIGDYASKINPYLKSKGDFNKVMKAPLDDLLLYGGIDSLLGYRLFKEQCKEIEDKDPVFFFVDGLISFANMEINGICADRKYYEEVDKKLEDEIVTIYKELHTSEEAKLFKASRGREINFNSDHDLRDLFFKIQDFEPSKKTETGLPSVDAEALHALKSPTAEKIIHLSKIDKVKGTYIGQFLREINEDGKIHPFFDLHPAVSFRGGVHLPNFQNLPKRDEEAERYSRSGVYPSPGNIILDWDFSGMEIRVCACVSQDKMLVKKIREGIELHAETASWVYDLDIERVSKKLRFYSKNGFFFPEIYGSYYANCARNIWDACKEHQLETADGENIFDHLLSVGIIKRKNDYDGFENHLKEVEKDFWNEYSGIKKWQENTQKFYDKHGYIELVTGFKCSGFMSKNQLFNFPIQGPAFHCLIYCIIEIDNYIIDERLKSKIIAQIHDNLIFDCYPPEKMKLIDISKDVVYNRISKDWKWIIVPLDIEIEETEINGSWISKKEVKI